MTREIVVTIPGMACKGCVASINSALQDQRAINDYEIDLSTKTVRVDSALPQEALIAVLKTAGYEAAAVK